MAKKSKWISRVCLAAAGFGLTAALALAPRQGVYTAETDLFWDGKLRDSVNQIGQARQDGFYLVQRGNREYLVTRGYDRAYEAPVWRLEGEKLTLSAGARFGEGSGVQLYRIQISGYDTILAEENGQSTFFQEIIVR